MFLKNLGIVRYHIKNLKQFDELTRFRLISLGIITFLLQLFIPIVTEFKGKYLFLIINNKVITAATIIAIIGILKTILEKFIPYLLNKTKISNIFKMKIFVDILITLSFIIFFINPHLFTWIDSILTVINTILVISLSITLTNYISFFQNHSFPKFQNYRLQVLTESTLIGLIISAILSTIDIKLNLILSIILYSIFILYQIKYIKKFEEYDFKYMIKYLKKAHNYSIKKGK